MYCIETSLNVLNYTSALYKSPVLCLRGIFRAATLLHTHYTSSAALQNLFKLLQVLCTLHSISTTKSTSEVTALVPVLK